MVSDLRKCWGLWALGGANPQSTANCTMGNSYLVLSNKILASINWYQSTDVGAVGLAS